MIRLAALAAVAGCTLVLHAPLPPLGSLGPPLEPIASPPGAAVGAAIGPAMADACRVLAWIVLAALPWLLPSVRGGSAALRTAGLCVLVAALLCMATLQQRIMGRWPQHLAGSDCELVGRIVSPVRALEGFGGRPAAGYDVAVSQLRCADEVPATSPERVRVSDWRAGQRSGSEVSAGERWRLTVRLDSPDGRLNPGGFDRERWLLLERIDALASVRAEPAPERLDRARWWQAGALAALRERAHARLGSLGDDAERRNRSDDRTAAVLAALSLGISDALDERWRERLQATGTAHLVAISGLHVGLVFGLLRALMTALARIGGRALGSGGPATRRWRGAADSLALIGAAVYALLSGFELPVQRALVMLVAWLALRHRARTLAPGTTLAVAVLAVLALDPLAPLSTGFWLSAGAVALLTVFTSARPATAPGDGGAAGAGVLARAIVRTARLARMQLWLSAALLPITAWGFLQVSWVSPLANLIAIPFVGTLLVPLAALITLLAQFEPTRALAGAGFTVARGAVDALTRGLDVAAGLPHAHQVASLPDVASLLLALAAVLLASRPIELRHRLAWLSLLPLLVAPAVAHNLGGRAVRGLEVHVLDVGHGLAVLLLTARSTVLYDTGGGRPGSGATRLERDVLPYLHTLGRRRIDRLVVSHLDRDHSAGLVPLLHRFPELPVLAPSIAELRERLPLPLASTAGLDACRAGEGFVIDGVHFDVLHPGPGEGGSDNDRSCVLLVTTEGAAVLLTGDIERSGERRLVGRTSGLPVDVLIAPHHGSDSSSGQAFVHAFPARHVVVGAARRSRWGFPHASVRMRYNQSGAQVHVTGHSGALVFRAPRRPWYGRSAERLARFGDPPTVHRISVRRSWRLP